MAYLIMQPSMFNKNKITVNNLKVTDDINYKNIDILDRITNYNTNRSDVFTYDDPS